MYDVDNPPATGLIQFSEVVGTPPTLTTFRPARGYLVSGSMPYPSHTIHLESLYDKVARNTQVLSFTYEFTGDSPSNFEIGRPNNSLAFEDLDERNNVRNRFRAISGLIRIDSREDGIYTISLVNVKLQKESSVSDPVSTCTMNGTLTVTNTFGS